MSNTENLIEELNELGYDIKKIDELKKITSKQESLIPILLKYLRIFNELNEKELIVRALGVKGFTFATDELLDEFLRSDKMTYKWAIGNTLSLIQDERFVDKYIEIALDKKHGMSRQMIVESLGNYDISKVKNPLVQLLTDDEVAGHAIIGITKLGDARLLEYVIPFLNHKVKWIRREAEKAVKKLEMK